MRVTFIILTFLIHSAFLFSQDNLQFTTEDLPGAKINRHEHFTGSNLWGHINGAADLFLEYGFKSLDYYEIIYDDIELRLEVYEFGDKFEAFGIYSIKKFGCREDFGKLKDLYCLTDFSLIFPEGKYYITIANNNGTDQQKALSIKLADIISNKIKAEPLSLNDLYPAVNPEYDFREVKLFKGPLGFQNGLPDWSVFFSPYENYTCIYYSIAHEEKSFDAFLFYFEETEELNRLLKDKSWELNDNELVLEQESGNNWLINLMDNLLIITTGNVEVEVMKGLRDIGT